LSLRIIAGELGGRRIETPVGRGTRPTREAVREAWFSALGDDIRGSGVLDLFAGSGALGIEALSRGAARVEFVESNRAVCRVLRENVRLLGIESLTAIRCADALSVVATLARSRRREWDIVLADPPYSGEAAADLVRAFDRFAFAHILCVEHSPRTELPRTADWRRAYGDTTLSFFVDPTEGDTGHE